MDGPDYGDACSTCRDNGRKGACARLRCYCGHNTCPAFDSWVSLDKPHRDVTDRSTTNTTWTEREGATWIDKL